MGDKIIFRHAAPKREKGRERAAEMAKFRPNAGRPQFFSSPRCARYSVGGQERVVHCWDKTGLLGAWKHSNGVDAVTRAAELFQNLRAERRGVDDAPPADPEPDTDVGVPLDCPSDLSVLQPNGSTYRGPACQRQRGSRAA